LSPSWKNEDEVARDRADGPHENRRVLFAKPGEAPDDETPMQRILRDARQTADDDHATAETLMRLARAAAGTDSTASSTSTVSLGGEPTCLVATAPSSQTTRGSAPPRAVQRFQAQRVSTDTNAKPHVVIPHMHGGDDSEGFLVDQT